MEGLILLSVIAALYWFYRWNQSNESDSKSGITKVDDKHWIINNELVSFDDNDDFHIMKQKMEDDSVWFKYVRFRKINDMKRISDEWYNIKMSPTYDILLAEVTDKDIIDHKEEYDVYIKKCKSVNWDTPLTKEEFCMRYKGGNIFSLLYMSPMFFPGVYNIHSSDNAKYSKNMMETLESEYKEKYY
jgi:hypothetical protein